MEVPFLPGAPVPFSGEQCLETRTWVLAVLIAGCSVLLHPGQTQLGGLQAHITYIHKCVCWRILAVVVLSAFTYLLGVISLATVSALFSVWHLHAPYPWVLVGTPSMPFCGCHRPQALSCWGSMGMLPEHICTSSPPPFTVLPSHHLRYVL